MKEGKHRNSEAGQYRRENQSEAEQGELVKGKRHSRQDTGLVCVCAV